jgi:hypothetical protein
LTVKWRQADSFVHVHYSIFSENTVNNALDSYTLRLHLSLCALPHSQSKTSGL